MAEHPSIQAAVDAVAYDDSIGLLGKNATVRVAVPELAAYARTLESELASYQNEHIGGASEEHANPLASPGESAENAIFGRGNNPAAASTSDEADTATGRAPEGTNDGTEAPEPPASSAPADQETPE